MQQKAWSTKAKLGAGCVLLTCGIAIAAVLLSSHSANHVQPCAKDLQKVKAFKYQCKHHKGDPGEPGESGESHCLAGNQTPLENPYDITCCPSAAPKCTAEQIPPD